MAPQYQGADLLLAADCAAFAAGNFHERFLKGKARCDVPVHQAIVGVRGDFVSES